MAGVAGTGARGMESANPVRGSASCGGVSVRMPMGNSGMILAGGTTDGKWISGDLATCGVCWRRCLRLRRVTRTDPSTRSTYWSYCRTSATIPVRSHLVGGGPTRFCSRTQLPMVSGGRTRVCSDSLSCVLI